MTNQNEQTITITLDKKDRENLIEILDYIYHKDIEGWLETSERVIKNMQIELKKLQDKKELRTQTLDYFRERFETAIRQVLENESDNLDADSKADILLTIEEELRQYEEENNA